MGKDIVDPDPWGNYYFSLELDGNEVAHFMECSGLKTTSQVFEIEEGGYNGHVHKRASQSTWDNIVLRTATNASMALLEWRDKYLQDDFKSRPKTNGAIIMRDNRGEALRRFNFFGAFPVTWEGPSFASGGSELSIETLEIAHEGITLDGAKPKPPEPAPPKPKNFAPDTIQFELNSAELTPAGEKTVDEISKSISESDSKTFWIEGHTCTLGPGGEGSSTSHAYNKKLSQERSQTVANELKKKHPDKTFIATGYSFDHPAASNSTSAGKSRNRRTDVFDAPPPGGRGWLK